MVPGPIKWPRLVTLMFLAALTVPAISVPFTFTNTPPTQCDPLTINWKGGQPPFRFLMIAPKRVMYNYTIPANAFNNDLGSFTIPQLMLPQYQRVAFTMSDAQGVSSGGITNLLAVGAPVGNVACNTASAIPDFFYSLDTDLEECKPYTFSLYPNATQPVTIYGFIMNGASFTLYPPPGDQFDWKNNLTAGTTVLFYMEDSLGRDGGISGTGVVRLSDDASCVSSTGDAGGNNSTTPDPSPSTKPGANPNTNHQTTPVPTQSSNVAVIAGAAGGGGALLLLGLLAGCCLWRRRRKRASRLPMVRPGRPGKGASKETVDLLDDADPMNPNHPSDATLAHYVVEPFTAEASSHSARGSESTPPPSIAATGGVGGGGNASGRARKEQMRLAIANEADGGARASVLMSEFGSRGGGGGGSGAGGSSRYSTAPTALGSTATGHGGSGYGPSFYASTRASREGLLTPGAESSFGDRNRGSSSSTAQRVIVHTDIAEADLMGDDQPLELPPMYSEGRTPIPGMLSSDIPTNSSSTASPADSSRPTPRSRKGP